MLRLTLEMVPFGNEQAKYKIGEMEICNVGGTNKEGDYTAILSSGKGVESISYKGFDRSRGAWKLVREILCDMGLTWNK